MSIFISPTIKKKLAEKHNVTEDEIRQCFINVEGEYLRDLREDHATDPPTWWFIAETNRKRKLKVCFMVRKLETPNGAETRIDIKTAFPPDLEDVECYERHGKC